MAPPPQDPATEDEPAGPGHFPLRAVVRIYSYFLIILSEHEVSGPQLITIIIQRCPKTQNADSSSHLRSQSKINITVVQVLPS